MAKARTCVCGTEPVWAVTESRYIIACPNKECNMNICSYPDEDTAVQKWNEEVERLGSSGKGN